MSFVKPVSRRRFLAGSVGLTFLAATRDAQAAGPARSKVLFARDRQVTADRIPQREPIRRLLAESMCTFFECKDDREAWASLFDPQDIVGLKVNCLGGRNMSTTVPLVEEICAALHRVGIPFSNMIVWDRSDRDLGRGGFTVNAEDPTRYQCYGSSSPHCGFDQESVPILDASTTYCRILTEKATKIINVPILKDHRRTGVTLAIKNHYGSISNPSEHHDNKCFPAVCYVYNYRHILEKTVLFITDCTKSVCDGGPQYNHRYAWYPNGLLVATDPVANDYIGWRIIEKERARRGLPTLEEVGRPTLFLAKAAELGLGTNSEDRIEFVQWER